MSLMNSKIAEALKLSSQPVAVFTSKEIPENAMQFRKGVWGCVIAMMYAVSKGKTAAFDRETVVCAGGKAGLGIQKFELGTIEYFLSIGGKGPKKGEFYKKSPDIARNYIETMPDIETDKYVIMKPLNELKENETPEIVIFLVNADQLSGLATLANYDQEMYTKRSPFLYNSFSSFSGDGGMCGKQLFSHRYLEGHCKKNLKSFRRKQNLI